jgi:hypothetical protein
MGEIRKAALDWYEMLIKQGWQLVVIAPEHNKEEVAQWVQDNIKNDCIDLHSMYGFKTKQEATWFTLRWG